MFNMDDPRDVPCKVCGTPTRAKDGKCTPCKNPSRPLTERHSERAMWLSNLWIRKPLIPTTAKD